VLLAGACTRTDTRQVFVTATPAADSTLEPRLTPPVPTLAPTPAPQPPVEVSVNDDPVRGPEDAAVTIIEFGDFQCPWSARFFFNTLPQLREGYGDRVRFVYRDFPLTDFPGAGPDKHPDAKKAAEAAECADDQGAFWDYHDLLFQNQNALDVDSLKGYAASVGLDIAVFNQCLESGKHASEVQEDIQDGLAAGVTGTPHFFINGRAVFGAEPYSVFEDAVEAALAEAVQ
jgi:protein-disulfide isomerase